MLISKTMIPISVPVTIPRYDVPLYSQISDISWPDWRQKGCGIVDVTMIIEFYKPNTTSVQEVLEQGIKSGAYVTKVGWSHDGLAKLAKKHGLVGKVYDFSKSDKDTAFSQFQNILKEGPVIASIHRGFDPKSPYGHLVVITGSDKDFIYYNDPGKREGIRKVSIADFKKGSKRRFIDISPPEEKTENAQVAIAR